MWQIYRIIFAVFRASVGQQPSCEVTFPPPPLSFIFPFQFTRLMQSVRVHLDRGIVKASDRYIPSCIVVVATNAVVTMENCMLRNIDGYLTPTPKALYILTGDISCRQRHPTTS